MRANLEIYNLRMIALADRHLLDENRAAAIEDGLCNHHERLTKLEART